MKVVIVAGGKGTRLVEETVARPKPMIEIGGYPILWHIMKIFGHYGFNEFIICLGYKGYFIKEYFSNYFLHSSDVTFDLANNKVSMQQNNVEPWRVTLVDTGEETMTGGRLKRVRKYLGNEDFFFTYGDGLANVNLPELYEFHRLHGRLATLTAVEPPARWGWINLVGSMVTNFEEKPRELGRYVSGGFMVLSPKVIDYIEGDTTIWEREPLERLSREEHLHAYTHRGFFQPMDTLRDSIYLNSLWSSGTAPWKIW